MEVDEFEGDLEQSVDGTWSPLYKGLGVKCVQIGNTRSSVGWLTVVCHQLM